MVDACVPLIVSDPIIQYSSIGQFHEILLGRRVLIYRPVLLLILLLKLLLTVVHSFIDQATAKKYRLKFGWQL